jgi:hypothetical protein
LRKTFYPITGFSDFIPCFYCGEETQLETSEGHPYKELLKKGLVFAAGLTDEKISHIQRMNSTRIYVHC